MGLTLIVKMRWHQRLLILRSIVRFRNLDTLENFQRYFVWKWLVNQVYFKCLIQWKNIIGKCSHVTNWIMLISCSRKWRAPGCQNLRSWRHRIGRYSVRHISVPGRSVKWLYSWCNEWMCFDMWLRWMQYWIRKRKTKCFQYFISVAVFVFLQENRSVTIK